MSKLDILMIVAHPDDEILFGFHDIYHNNVDIICMTNGNNNIRREEFNTCIRKINELKDTASSKIKGKILSLNDSVKDTWENYKTDEIIGFMKPFIKKKYNKIITHDEKGEYGNLQHMKVNKICKELSKELNVEYMTFASRYNSVDYENNDFVKKRNMLLDIYVSQKSIISELKNFYDNGYAINIKSSILSDKQKKQILYSKHK
jgi:LmbE family N-acetylglucosaminyl deacetylase